MHTSISRAAHSAQSGGAPHGERHPRAVIFDFGMVIATFDVAIFLDRLSGLTGRSIHEMAEFITRVRDLVTQFESGLVNPAEFYQEALRRGGFNLPPGPFRRAYSSIFTPIPSTTALIRSLHGRYDLGLLSNTSQWHFEDVIRPMEIFPLFDAVTLSFEVRAMKPAEAIYHDVLRKLRAQPGDCVYLDDIAENVEAAERLGMRAVQVRSPEGLIESLRQLGIRA